jgi:hypothetical protein
MNIHSLMHQFAQFDGAQVGHGPKHPTEPNLTLTEEIATFFNHYSFLQHDQGYVDFQEYYAGASVIILSDNNLTVDIDIFGFLDVSTHMTKYEDPIVDEDGHLVFSYILFNKKQFSFSFNTNREWGVYRTVVWENLDRQTSWYCATFLEWLERLIQYQGRLDE